MKIISLILLILASTSIFSMEHEKLRAVVRINRSTQGMVIVPMEKEGTFPSLPGNEKMKKILSEIKDGSEAIIEGHISYEPISSDNGQQFRPFFVIDSIHPISLSELGADARKVQIDTLLPIHSRPIYSPPFIPVSSEVATALTLTTSFLLLESLSNVHNTNVHSDTNKALFVSAGAMATVLFIYEQVKGDKKK